MKQQIECLACQSSCDIKHEMDDIIYEVRFCPFCGEELELEEGLPVELDPNDEPVDEDW